MTSDNRSNEQPRHYGCLVLVFILLLLVLIAVALFWRSAWWTEAGAPVPRGTERLSHPSAIHV